MVTTVRIDNVIHIDFRAPRPLCRDCGKRAKLRSGHRCAACEHYAQQEQRRDLCTGCRCVVDTRKALPIDTVTGRVWCSVPCWYATEVAAQKVTT